MAKKNNTPPENSGGVKIKINKSERDKKKKKKEYDRHRYAMSIAKKDIEAENLKKYSFISSPLPKGKIKTAYRKRVEKDFLGYLSGYYHISKESIKSILYFEYRIVKNKTETIKKISLLIEKYLEKKGSFYHSLVRFEDLGDFLDKDININFNSIFYNKSNFIFTIRKIFQRLTSGFIYCRIGVWSSLKEDDLFFFQISFNIEAMLLADSQEKSFYLEEQEDKTKKFINIDIHFKS